MTAPNSTGFTIHLVLALCLLIVSFAPSPSYADSYRAAVHQVLSDGESGRDFNEWRYTPEDKPIAQVDIIATRRSGDASTYATLSFSDVGVSNEENQRLLSNNNKTTLLWDIGGQKAQGRELVINVHKGEVEVHSVVIEYRLEAMPLPESP